jgi:hypothetical protein
MKIKCVALFCLYLILLVGCAEVCCKSQGALCRPPREDPNASFYERHLNRDGLGADALNGFVPAMVFGLLGDAVEKKISQQK